MDVGTGIVNWLVEHTTGRDGLLGYFYTEPTKAEAERRRDELAATRMRLEIQLEDLAAVQHRLERKTKGLWKNGRETEARQAARDLRAAQNSYTRTGQQKSNADAVFEMMQELVAGDAIEQHVEFYAMAMGERLQVANPQRMARVLHRCSTLDEMRRMTSEQLKEHFDAAEQDELERVSDERDDDQLTEDVLVKLGCIRRVEDAAVPPSTLPGSSRGPSGADERRVDSGK